MGSTSRGSKPRGRAVAGRDPGRPKRRRLWFGPGTIIALLIGVAALTMRGGRSDAERFAETGRLIYQADSQGRMQRVEKPAEGAVPSPTKPLWKPEVGLLLERASDLRLTSAQKSAIAELESAWRAEKSALEAELRSASGDATGMMERPSPERGAALQLLQRGLRDYSALSREYDARRADHWERGLMKLDSKQRALLEGVRSVGAVPAQKGVRSVGAKASRDHERLGEMDVVPIHRGADRADALQPRQEVAP